VRFRAPLHLFDIARQTMDLANSSSSVMTIDLTGTMAPRWKGVDLSGSQVKRSNGLPEARLPRLGISTGQMK
jgi:hypothetical protein